jgi:Tex-like protein N-terminal domain
VLAAAASPVPNRCATFIDRQIAQELAVREEQVAAAVALLDDGATVPFVARYRKEATGGLDDAQLRTLDERLRYLRELEERRTVILNSIREQGKLDDVLEAAIRVAESKGRLEDIYLPFKPKRRTKAEIAKEAGLEPLADLLLAQPEPDPSAGASCLAQDMQNVHRDDRAHDGGLSGCIIRRRDLDHVATNRIDALQVPEDFALQRRCQPTGCGRPRAAGIRRVHSIDIERDVALAGADHFRSSPRLLCHPCEGSDRRSAHVTWGWVARVSGCRSGSMTPDRSDPPARQRRTCCRGIDGELPSSRRGRRNGSVKAVHVSWHAP